MRCGSRARRAPPCFGSSRARARVVKTIAVGNGPVDVAVGDGAAWIANRQDATVSRVDPATDAVTDTRRCHAIRARSRPATAACGWRTRRRDRCADRPRDAANGRDDRGREQPERARRRGRQGVDGGARRAGDPPRRDTAGAGGPVRGTTASSPPATTTSRPKRCSRSPTTASSPTGAPAARRTATLVGGLATESRPRARRADLRLQAAPDLRYSDGSPVRPEDFRASLERLRAAARAGVGLPGDRGRAAVRDRPRAATSPPGSRPTRGRTITIHLTDPTGSSSTGSPSRSLFVVPSTAQPFVLARRLPGTGPTGSSAMTRNAARAWSATRISASWSPARGPTVSPTISQSSSGHPTDAQLAAVGARRRRRRAVVSGPFFGGMVQAGQRAGARRPRPDSSNQCLFRNSTSCCSTTGMPPSTTRRPTRRSTRRRPATAGSSGGPDLVQPTCQLLPPGFPNYRPRCPYTLDASPAGTWTAPNLAKARRLVRDSGTRGARGENLDRTQPRARWGATSRRCCGDLAGGPRCASFLRRRPTSTPSRRMRPSTCGRSAG